MIKIFKYSGMAYEKKNRSVKGNHKKINIVFYYKLNNLI